VLEAPQRLLIAAHHLLQLLISVFLLARQEALAQLEAQALLAPLDRRQRLQSAQRQR
jgi:hypothetical protein